MYTKNFSMNKWFIRSHSEQNRLVYRLMKESQLSSLAAYIPRFIYIRAIESKIQEALRMLKKEKQARLQAKC